MWFNKKKSNEAPMPPRPVFPMPEPVKLPEVYEEMISQPVQEETLMGPPVSEEVQNPIINSVPVQEIKKLNPSHKMEYGTLNSNVHFSKRKEISGDQEFFFLEKTNYMTIRDLLSGVDLISRNSIEYIDEINVEKSSEDAICAEFGVVMEEIQKKILFVDKTLFGE